LLLLPGVQHLEKTKLTDFSVTIVYVESLEALGYFHQFLNYELKDQ
jgi:hypothetical protein